MLHKIQPKEKKKKSKRVGRGGKRGTYSGRGLKGQKARSGSSTRPDIRDYIIRLPKRRGFRNNPKSQKPKVVNVSDLEKSFQKGDVVSPKSLITKKVLIPSKSDSQPKYIKILGSGTLTKPLHVKGLETSKTAREKIESAGGTVE